MLFYPADFILVLVDYYTFLKQWVYCFCIVH
jgi:hypothetical protein